MVNISKLKLTLLEQEILRTLNKKAGTTLNARNLSNLVSVSQPAISKSLPKLEKLDLITVRKDKLSGRLSIELNRDNQKVIGLKRVDNLKQIYDSDFVYYLYDLFPGSTIILFGSYSHGEDTILSDIDIAIIGTKEKILDLANFEKLLERKIIINFYKDFKSINAHLLNNILNGIVIRGSIELWQ